MAAVSELVLDRVSASEAQRAEMAAILDEAAPRAFAHRQEGEALRADLREELTAETIDREALEEIRASALELADRGSRELVSAVADLAEVLTPAQRREIADEVERWHR
jgi:Spy/CpxP family protein refolding chaperone